MNKESVSPAASAPGHALVQVKRVEIHAVVTRANGTVEDLGMVAEATPLAEEAQE